MVKHEQTQKLLRFWCRTFGVIYSLTSTRLQCPTYLCQGPWLQCTSGRSDHTFQNGNPGLGQAVQVSAGWGTLCILSTASLSCPCAPSHFVALSSGGARRAFRERCGSKKRICKAWWKVETNMKSSIWMHMVLCGMLCPACCLYYTGCPFRICNMFVLFSQLFDMQSSWGKLSAWGRLPKFISRNRFDPICAQHFHSPRASGDLVLDVCINVNLTPFFTRECLWKWNCQPELISTCMFVLPTNASGNSARVNVELVSCS